MHAVGACPGRTPPPPGPCLRSVQDLLWGGCACHFAVHKCASCSTAREPAPSCTGPNAAECCTGSRLHVCKCHVHEHSTHGAMAHLAQHNPARKHGRCSRTAHNWPTGTASGNRTHPLDKLSDRLLLLLLFALKHGSRVAVATKEEVLERRRLLGHTHSGANQLRPDSCGKARRRRRPPAKASTLVACSGALTDTLRGHAHLVVVVLLVGDPLLLRLCHPAAELASRGVDPRKKHAEKRFGRVMMRTGSSDRGHLTAHSALYARKCRLCSRVHGGIIH